jgi:4-amino-4-deoxy-L-arabinose transferase-like glycosyltransferase
MNRTSYSFLLVMGASLLLSLLYCPPFDQMLDDREFFQYCGMALLKGQVPYRDFFDHKPPLIYFINALGLALGMGRWGLWLISTGCALVVTLLLFRLARQYRLHYPWLLPLLFNLMLRDFLISERINLTREYSTFFVMLFFWALMEKRGRRYFLAGLFTALTFFTQQDQVLLLTPFILYALMTRDDRSVPYRLVQLAAGFLCIALPQLLYFAFNHSLSYFWSDAYAFNFSVYIREYKSMGDHFRTIKRVLDDGNYEFPFMIALVLGTTALFLPHKKKGLLVAALAALFLSMSSELMGGRLDVTRSLTDFRGYFLPLSATVCILLFVVFAFTTEKTLADRTTQLPFALLLCCSLGYTALQHAANLQRRSADPRVNRPELAYLQARQLKDYQLYVMLDGEYTYCYNALGILAPSPWVYQHFWVWYKQWDPDHRILESIARDLLQHHTTYVILEPDRLLLMANQADRDWWMSFMQAHYKPMTLPGSPTSVLWCLKGP